MVAPARTTQPLGSCSNVTIGYVDRVNVYEYSRSAPNIFVDPSGMICQSTCCCCVESISIDDVHKVDGLTLPFPYPPFPGENGILGHKFDANIQLSYKRSDEAGDCTLKWFETTNEPYFPGMIPHREIDVFEHYPGPREPGGTFFPWIDRKKPCPGNESVTLHDQPQMGKGFDNKKTFERYLLIRIVVESSPNCDCKSNKVWITARQVLGVRLGKTVRADFNSPAVPYMY